MFCESIKEVYVHRDLLVALTYRDIRVKYKQAVMGMCWAFFLLVLAISSGILFRLAMAYFSGQAPRLDDMVAVAVKSVPWLLFAGIIGGASNSLIGNLGLMTKIYFPREVVPLAAVLSSLFDFLISLIGLAVLLIVLAWWYGSQSPIVMSWQLLWVPALLTILIVLATGAALLLSCANVFFRDVKYIVQVMLQFGIFFSLVYFSYTELGEWGFVLLANPVAPLLEGLRMAVVDGNIPGDFLPAIGYSAAVAVVGLLAAVVIFERAEYLFAEYA